MNGIILVNPKHNPYGQSSPWIWDCGPYTLEHARLLCSVSWYPLPRGFVYSDSHLHDGMIVNCLSVLYMALVILKMYKFPTLWHRILGNSCYVGIIDREKVNMSMWELGWSFRTLTPNFIIQTSCYLVDCPETEIICCVWIFLNIRLSYK